MAAHVAPDPVRVVVGLARSLREAGVPVGGDRVRACVESLGALDAAARDDVYWAGRLTLCGRREDHPAYDRAFAAIFDGMPPAVPPRRARASMVVVPVAAGTEPGGAEDGDERELAPAAASQVETLRSRDVAELSEREREELKRLLAALRMPGELRRTRRWEPAKRGPVDRRATVRHLLRTGGEPLRLPRRAHRRRPRRVVLLADVSGSMGAYADALLRFAHAAARRPGARTEIFTIGTRLTRVTRELRRREPDRAMAEVAAAVPDWSGGTRLGELIKEFLDDWGQRGMARGAVVVILSDGWEQGDASLLADQMARLRRLAHRVVWANPRKARPGYEPLVAGMAAALPHVDDFVEGHSLDALERLARIVAGAQETEEVAHA